MKRGYFLQITFERNVRNDEGERNLSNAAQNDVVEAQTKGSDSLRFSNSSRCARSSRRS